MIYELDKMSDEKAKMILQDLLNQLAEIDKDDLTTFELNLLRRAAKDVPKDLPRSGVESSYK